jgi:GNAT superfamily N-acetyltransferase
MDARARFRAAAVSLLGQTLTPKAAAALEAAAFGIPDESIDPARWAPLEYEGFVIRVERFRDVLPELKPLHFDHWLETEKHRHGLPFDPDYEGMRVRELQGRLLQFTVRRDGALVGHLRMYLLRSMHSGTDYASEDTLYLRPKVRGGFLAVKLMRYAEAACISLGVAEIRSDSKLINKADVLMKRLGYTPVALQFVKIIK